VSNLLERGDRRFTIRPEKIRLLTDGEPPEPGDSSEGGRIRDIVYIGSVTRYIVELDAGGTLTVVKQNLDSFQAAGEERGRPVVLAWRPESTFTIESPDREEEGV
jgi:putative spermidine/putrescine transport system ATP-binding protein